MRHPTRLYLILAIAVIALGIASRTIRFGQPLWDKYSGDTLYAILAYLILSILWRWGKPTFKAVVAIGIMLLIESFQLTGIPSELRRHANPVWRIVAILLGTEFQWLDVVAYFVGITAIAILDWSVVGSGTELKK
jgi:Protein of unknown function (DUF2809)